MRKPLALVLTIGLALSLASLALAASKTIKMGDNYYVKSRGVPTVTVAKNTTVTWKNSGKAPHTVTVSKGPVKFKSGKVEAGKSYKKKVSRAGSYTIFCKIHGASDQKMTLKVR